MRVAYVCTDPGIPVFGSKGCSLHVQEILRALIERDACVELFAVRIGGEPPAGCESVRVHQIPVAVTRNREAREQALIDTGPVLWDMIEQLRPFDLVYERHALWSSAAMQWADDRGVPSILEVNAPLIDEQATHRSLFDLRAAQYYATCSLAAARVVACVSQPIMHYALSLGADPSRLVVTPNGVRPAAAPRRIPRASEAAPFTIGFVGSLRPWHAVGDLVQAFAMLVDAPGGPDSRLVIVGDGPQRETLTQQIASLPKQVGERIELVGAVPPQDVPDWLSRFDAAVAPYAADGDCYFSPLKLFEYMAGGLPTVAADAGQMREIITRGSTGLLYRPGDVRDLCDQLRWLAAEPQAAEALGAAARLEALEQHTWQQRLDQMLQVAHRVPSSNPTGGAV